MGITPIVTRRRRPSRPGAFAFAFAVVSPIARDRGRESWRFRAQCTTRRTDGRVESHQLSRRRRRRSNAEMRVGPLTGLVDQSRPGPPMVHWGHDWSTSPFQWSKGRVGVGDARRRACVRRHWRGVRVRAFTDGAFDDGDGVVRTATASTWM